MRSTFSVSALVLAGLLSSSAASAESIMAGSSSQSLNRDQAAIDSLLPAPDKPLLVAPPLCPGPGCPDFDGAATPQAQYKRILYLNFDGATIKSGSDNATQNTSRIIRFTSRAIPGLTKEDLNPSSVGELSLQQIKDIVVDNVRFHMQPYNVEVVTERPSSGSYHMIVFSPKDDCETIAGATCAGIAPLDCSDNNPSNIVWVFAGGLRVSDLATTSSHEAAHSLGVFHTLDTKDIMFPSILNSVPDYFGAGDIPDGDTNCEGQTFQDSNELLISTIGPALSDTTAPDVEITQPAAGLTIGPGAMIEARANDTQGPIEKVEFFLNGESVRVLDREQRPWVMFLGPQQPAGALSIKVVATDMAGNTAESSVEVEFDRGGNTPCTTDEQCSAGLECNGAVCVPEDPSAGALGSECAVNDDCDSGVCASLQGQSLCTQTCDEANPCPGGFDCLDGGGCWPADGGGGGCSVQGSAGGSLFALIFLGAFVGLGFRRRRA